MLIAESLSVEYLTRHGAVRAVRNISFSVGAGEKFGLLGESGSGKSTVLLAIMNILRAPARVEAKRLRLDDIDLLSLDERELTRMRSAQIAIVPQGAMNTLNPVRRIGTQIADIFIDHGRALSRSELADRIQNLLVDVGLDPGVAKMFPHELSGGMKQRVTIAMAVSLNPKLLLADEPTSSLDVVVQKGVMSMLDKIHQRLGSALIMVGHDIGLMTQFVDRVAVMYAGEIMELGPIHDLVRKPKHPYTRALLEAVPSKESRGKFSGIAGIPPSLRNPPPGCPFQPRCSRATDLCAMSKPSFDGQGAHSWACHHPLEGQG